jgi:hypothetical protein
LLRVYYAEYRRWQTRGVPRDGKALLQGIVYCGECGHKMTLRYGRATQYRCDYLWFRYGEPHCQRLPADRIDDQVVRWFFEALSVAEIDLSSRALETTDRTIDQLLAARKRELQRLQYQAKLAERQYNHSDPENRLVAAELERRWEAALRECKEAEKRLHDEESRSSCFAIPAELIEQLKSIGAHLPVLWEQKLLRASQMKALLRTLIDKVILHRFVLDKVQVRVVWRGGMTTTADLPVPVATLARLSNSEEFKASILRLAREGQSDKEIAAVLTAQGHRSPLSDKVLPDTVNKIRLANHVFRKPNNSRPLLIQGYLTISQLVEMLKLPHSWFHGRIARGSIRAKKDVERNCYLFPDEPATLAQFRQFIDGQVSHLDFLGGHQDG